MSNPDIRITSELKTQPLARENSWEGIRRTGGFFNRRLNLGVKLPLFTLILLSLALFVSTYLNINATRTALIDVIKDELAAQAESKVEIIRANLIWTRGAAIDLAAAAEAANYDEETILKVIYNTLMRNEQIFGSTIAYEPYQFNPELFYWSPYYSRVSDTELKFTQLGNPEYNYFNWSWYNLPKTTRTPILSAPYFDMGGGNIWMVTWSAPFFDETGKVKGVATADIAFSRIQEIAENIEVGEAGYSFLLDSQGIILGIGKNAGGYYEPMSDNMKISVYSAKARDWDILVNEMLEGKTGFLEVTDPQGKTAFVSYIPVGLETGWSLALVFPKEEVLQKTISSQNTLIVYSILIVLVFGVVAYLFTRSITQPLHRLTQHAGQLSAEKLKRVGDSLAEPVQIRTRDELEDLANVFNQMSSDLAQSFENLEEKIADRSRHLERRSLELETIAEVAREITIIHDLNTLLNVSANLIRERFQYYHVGIFLVDERGEFAVLRAASSIAASQLLEQNYKLKVGQEGMVGNVTRTGQAHIALDIGTDAIHFQNPFLPDTRSEITLPLRIRSMTIGALDIQTDVPSAFGEQDIRVLQLLADQLSAAIENVQLVQQVETALTELNMTHRLQTQNAWRSSVSQYDIPAYEYDGIQVRPVPGNLPDNLLLQLENGEPIVIGEGKEQNSDHGKTTLLVPLMVMDQVIGVIGLEQENPDYVWTDEEIAIAQAAANRAGITLENARLLEESQRRAIKERTIFDATERIGSALNIENILHATAEEIERILGNSEVILQFNNDNVSSTNEE